MNTTTAPSPTQTPAQQRANLIRGKFGTHASTVAVGAFLIALVVGFFIATPDFLTSSNVLNMLRQVAPTLIAALAMTFVITSGGIDLSVGSNVAVSGSALAILVSDGFNPGLAVLFAVALGAILGAFQGYFVAYQGIFAFIVTLAGLYGLRGIALAMTNGYSIAIPESWILTLGQGRVLGIPVPVLIAAVLSGFAWFLFNKTPFGRYIVALGSNAESLRRTGVNIRRVTFMAYVFSGMFAAIAGVLLATRLASGSSNTGMFFELEVITAVVLGGTNLFGGRGTILGTILGSLVLGVILNGLVLVGVSPFYVQVVTGAILLAAVTANAHIDKRFTILKG
jgi:simple sugar transport system permease protein